MKQCILIVYCLYLCVWCVYGQNQELDSLQTVLRSETNDSLKIITLTNLAFAYRNISPDEVYTYSTQALKIAEKNKSKHGKLASYSMIALSYYLRSNYEKSLKYMLNGVKLAEELHLPDKANKFRANIAVVYFAVGQDDKALEVYQQLVREYKKLGEKAAIARTYNNIASIHKSKKEFDVALDYYKKAITIFEKLGDQQELSLYYTNIASLYDDMNQLEKAIENALKGREYAEELQATAWIAENNIILGDIYTKKQQYSMAQDTIIKNKFSV